jgi:Uma2 family endonuclease
MSSSLLDQAVRGEAFPEPLTTDQYHRMIEAGILVEGTPIELIDGILVRKDRRDSGQDSIMTVGPDHSDVVSELYLLLTQLLSELECFVRSQQPVHIPPSHEPEPDVSLLRKKVTGRHPGAEDLLLVVEVADSSLRYDRETKLPIYASAGIPEYWIVNLADRCVEVYTQADKSSAAYASRQDFTSGQAIELEVEGQIMSLNVDLIFPA